jgi:RND family efflux transporter MFP subunit
MNVNTPTVTVVRSAKRVWRTWLFIGMVAVLVGDAAYHVFSREPQPQAEIAKTAPASQPTIVKLSPAQIADGGIVVEPLTAKSSSEIFRAPGEVKVNDYLTSNVSPRVSATVLTRHAKLGDRVRKGQDLITLYSANMAEAQSAFVLADKYFERIRKLGAPYVSGKDFDEAQVKQQEARGRLETYGLMASEIADIAANGLATRAAGQFQLTAAQDGVITGDNFRVGEVADPAKTLFEISNLSTVWVEAQVSPAQISSIKGNRARVYVRGTPREARIIQTQTQLNETTRTLGVRLQLENPDGTLKPGEFVDVELFGDAKPELVIPTAAVLRDADGSWVVYVEKAPGSFEPSHVQVLRAAGDETVISGIPAGTRVVTKGAFFVKSEADKSSLADEG